jgi:predicted DCC family thiol-disulfide oxidoreductase YuxK
MNDIAHEVPRAVVVYDGACAFCRRQVDWIRARSGDQFEFVPRQDPALLARFPALNHAGLESGMRLVLPDGAVAVGADAVYQIARRLRGWRWPALAYRVPGLNLLARSAYAWIAKNRYRFAHCSDDSCTRGD